MNELRYAIINLQHLRDNYRHLTNLVQAHTQGASLLAVLKADAYGHGAIPCAKVLEEAGCSSFGVSTAEEALSLADVVRGQILLLEPPDLSMLSALAQKGVTLTLSDEDSAQALLSLYQENLANLQISSEKPLSVALKVDTGMHRFGFSPTGAIAMAKTLVSLPNIRLDAVFSHLTNGESASRAKAQKAQLSLVFDALSSLNIRVPFHLSASSAILNHQSFGFPIFRSGLSLYGIGKDNALSPVMQVFGKILHIRHLKKGDSIGYENAWRATKDMQVGVVATGYADGLLRHSQGGPVTCLGKKTTLVGSVCMDTCFVSLERIPAKVGDVVEFFGELPALASHAGTIPYEYLTLLGARVKRFYQ